MDSDLPSTGFMGGFFLTRPTLRPIVFDRTDMASGINAYQFISS